MSQLKESDVEAEEVYIDKVLDRVFDLVKIDKWWEDLLSQDVDYDFCREYPLPVENSVDNSNFDMDSARDGIPWGESYAATLVSNKFRKYLSFNADENIWYLWNGIIHMPMQNPMAAEEVMERFLHAYERAYDYVEWVVSSEAAKIKAVKGSKDGQDEADKYERAFEKAFKKHKDFRNRLRPPEGRNRVIADMKRKLANDPRRFVDDTRWFVFRNGVIDCQEVRKDGQIELYGPNSNRNVTRYFDADYVNLEDEPEKNLGYWDKFIQTSIPDDEVREYVQACVGAAFTGNTKLRTFLVFDGERSSGKSLFLEVLGELGRRSDPEVDGSSYTNGNANPSAIIKVKGGRNFAQAEFGNNRIVGISEPNIHEEVDGEFIKAYTGDHTVSTEKKHKDYHVDIAQGLLIVATNQMLRINSSDTAVMNRAKIVKFPYSFLANPDPNNPYELKSDEYLKEHLLEDRSAILWWIIEGMIIHKTGYNSAGASYNRLEDSAPPIMNEWMKELKSELQTPVTWLQFMIDNESIEYVTETMEIISRKKSSMIRTSEAYKVYKAWCEDNGIAYPKGNREFTRMILEQFGVAGHDKTEGNDYARFPVLFSTEKFLGYLDEARLRTS